jgi:hypothetical protein
MEEKLTREGPALKCNFIACTRRNKISKKESAKTGTRIPHSLDSTPFYHLRSYHLTFRFQIHKKQ